MGFSWKIKLLKFRSVHPVPAQAEERGQLGPTPARRGDCAPDGSMACDISLLYKTVANRSCRKTEHCLVLLAIKLKSSAKHHRMAWIGKDLKDYFVPNPLPWAGTSSPRAGFWSMDTIPPHH